MHGKSSAKAMFRTAMAGIAVLLCVMLQITVFPYLRFFGCIPDITASCLICLSLFEKEKTVWYYTILSVF